MEVNQRPRSSPCIGAPEEFDEGLLPTGSIGEVFETNLWPVYKRSGEAVRRSVQKETKPSSPIHRSVIKLSLRDTMNAIVIIVSTLSLMVALFGSSLAAPQFFQLSPEAPYAHPAVLINSHMESELPEELRNPFYKNPRIANGLAKESWFGKKEMQVLDREAEKIPREKIYSVLHHAGLARRK